MPPPLDFTGGDALMEVLRRISDRTRATASGTPEVKVGFLENSTYPDGTSQPMVAAVQEFGSDRIPPRPFFRNMIAAEKGRWGATLAQLLRNTDFSTSQCLGLMGENIAGKLRKSIVDTNIPPLAPSTIARKSKGKVTKIAGVLGPAKPLVDTGHMLNSVDYEVTT